MVALDDVVQNASNNGFIVQYKDLVEGHGARRLEWCLRESGI